MEQQKKKEEKKKHAKKATVIQVGIMHWIGPIIKRGIFLRILRPVQATGERKRAWYEGVSQFYAQASANQFEHVGPDSRECQQSCKTTKRLKTRT